MTHTFKIFLSLAVWLVAQTLVFAQETKLWNAENIEMTHLKDARRYVCNPDGVLSQTAVDSIDAALYQLDKTKGVEFVVVVVKRLEGGEPYEVGKQLFEKYKFGKKDADTGLLLILSTEDRAYFINTGKGLEGTLPDAICKRIGYRVMEPLMKEAKWDEAITSGVVSLIRVINEDQEFVEALNDDDSDMLGVGFGVGGILLALGCGIAAERYSRPKCSRCGKRMKKVRKILTRKTHAARFYDVLYRCPHCHNEMNRTERFEVESTTMVGGGFGHGGYGGSHGSFGGSFGGGSYGGGGAGGRF